MEGRMTGAEVGFAVKWGIFVGAGVAERAGFGVTTGMGAVSRGLAVAHTAMQKAQPAQSLS